MDRADRTFAVLITVALVSVTLFAVPLLITLFPGALQHLLHDPGAFALVCAAALYELGRELPALGVLVVALALVGIGLGGVELVRVLRRTQRALARHRPVTVPARLAAVVAAAGMPSDVVCFEDARALAYCRGLLRPRIWISSGAVALLDERELEAVLRHEDFHRHHLDPLRILVARTLSSLLFGVPLIDHLAARFAVAKELDADLAAVRAQGTTRHVAGALYALGSSRLASAPDRIAVGAWSLSRARVDQLCGSSDRTLLPAARRRVQWATAAALTLALILGSGQAARANLVPASAIDPIASAFGSPSTHACLVPMHGVLF